MKRNCNSVCVPGARDEAGCRLSSVRGQEEAGGCEEDTRHPEILGEAAETQERRNNKER